MIFYSETKKLRVYRKGNSIQFVDGKFETEDEKDIELLSRVPECWSDEPAELEEIEQTEDEPAELETLSSTELRAYAKENRIELPKGLRGADEVLAAIKDAE